MKKIILLILPILIIFGSCKKYTDGPAVSLNTKRHRVVNSWVIDQVFQSGIDQTSSYKSVYFNFNLITRKDHSYSLTFVDNNITNYSETGTWDFDNDKARFILKNSINSTYSAMGYVWVIYKLKEKEFWIKTVDNNGSTVEIHFKPM